MLVASQQLRVDKIEVNRVGHESGPSMVRVGSGHISAID